MHRSAQREILTLVRPPGRVSRLDAAGEDDSRTQREARARDVVFRSIVDAEFLALPGAAERIRADMRVGEEVRVFPSLPFKLLVADRRIALIPLDVHQPASPVLLVRSSSLLDALCALFDTLWQKAAPIAAELPVGAAEDGNLRELLPLLTLGMNDKAIAHELGISLRTLNRRIGDFTRSIDARSRFQAGWIAALRFAGKP